MPLNVEELRAETESLRLELEKQRRQFESFQRQAKQSEAMTVEAKKHTALLQAMQPFSFRNSEHVIKLLKDDIHE